jgi:ketosteroid isomerase-like protein
VSKANIEIVRRAIAAAIRKPKPDFMTVNALYDPEHELVTPISRLEGRTLRGAEGFRGWLAGIGEDWETLTHELERVDALDSERVLAATTFRGRSRRGGVSIAQQQGLVVTVRDGKVVRTEAYSSVDEALAAISRPQPS